MTIDEIKTKICDLRCSVEELQEQAQELWRETEDERTEKVADYLDNELGYIAYRLSELEELQTDSEGNVDTDGLEVGLQEWWEELPNDEKASLVGIPAPSGNDARGCDQYEFDEYCNKWWNAKTISQKQETYKEWADEMPWWEKED